MRLHTLWNFCVFIFAVISLTETAVISNRRHVNTLNAEEKSAEANQAVHNKIPPPRQKSLHGLKWYQEDNDKSNERNLWISHPKPKTQYDGPDTQESEGPAIPKKSLWAKSKKFPVKIRNRLRGKSFHENTSAAIW